MNNIGLICIILICVGIGYVIEPIIIADKDSSVESAEFDGLVSNEGNEVEVSAEGSALPIKEEVPSESVAVDLSEEVAPLETKENIEAQDELEEKIKEVPEEVGQKVEETPEEVEEAVIPPVGTQEPVATETDQTSSIVDVMKASAEEGEVTEFKSGDVISWKEGEPFEFEGESYVTGVVTFKSETILGIQENDAIALIKDGAVYKWLWEKTKLEMR